MVLVQILFEVFHFLRGGQLLYRQLQNRKATPSSLQDALLCLASVTDSASLQDAIQSAVRTVLTDVVSAYLYQLDVETGCMACEAPFHELITEGKLRADVQQGKRVVCDGLPPSELQEEQKETLAQPLQGDRKALIGPLLDKGVVIGALLISCNRPSQKQEQELDLLEQHITIACKRVQLLKNQRPAVDLEVERSPSVSQTPVPVHSQPNLRLLQLCGDLYDTSAASLQLKLNKYLQEETQSQCCCFLLLSEDNKQFFCKVVGDKVLEEEICFPMAVGQFGKAMETRRSISLHNLSGEEQQQVKGILGYEAKSVLCVPAICRATDQAFALTCIFNKRNANKFSEEDEKVVSQCLLHTSAVLNSTLAFQREQQLKTACQKLLQVAKNLFTHLDDVSVLLTEIIAEARCLSNAESCSVFLLDKQNQELVAKVFDGGVVTEKEAELRIPVNQGIAGHVATTGDILNITDAYSHPLFYRAVDEFTGFRTRSILCFPIKDVDGVVIGVAELVNKINAPGFNRFDEELAIAFSIYCGISIAHSLLYKKVREAQYRSTLANEMMRYHMKVSDEEVTALLNNGIKAVCEIHPSFTEFSYIPRSLTDDDTAKAVISMFEDMGFINTYKINKNTLARFCLMVKKGYRDPPYHNWMHGFSVAHFCYLLSKNLDMRNHLEDFEVLALFVSCLCHDLDHRGTNNSFQIKSKSVLAGLYSSQGSVLERHHFAQAISILNTQGCNIFDQFSRKGYQRMLDLMRDIILATDLAHHLRILGDLRKMAEEGYDNTNLQHHNLLLCLLMTSCDLSDQTKEWRTTRKVAKLIYKEFFSQGDREKEMGNSPIPMMDREKAYIPELQTSFMEHIVIPVFKTLQDLFPASAELHKSIISNHEKWTHISHKYRGLGLPSKDCLDLLDEECDPFEGESQ
ncbi:cGMP-dependent 3',5'-cyclic phosphodiesterase [Chanos chanos]|uniref:Phosphodiesterase n=1 Tax=Chanos chanos TaxID=29144 RepID=A0A6J2VYU5_CHACN|nr:cGMP-dependent 3',5'-cyclic phosphodiesterase-like [Chanos chanos]